MGLQFELPFGNRLVTSLAVREQHGNILTWIENQSDRNISVKTVADVMGGGSAAPMVAVTAPANASKVRSGTPELTGTADGYVQVAGTGRWASCIAACARSRRRS